MGWKRSGFEWERVNIYGQVLLGFMYICTIQTSSAVTDPTDGKDSPHNIHCIISIPLHSTISHIFNSIVVYYSLLKNDNVRFQV